MCSLQYRPSLRLELRLLTANVKTALEKKLRSIAFEKDSIILARSITDA